MKILPNFVCVLWMTRVNSNWLNGQCKWNESTFWALLDYELLNQVNIRSLLTDRLQMSVHVNKSILHIDGFAQDCSNSIANALELLQSCTKPTIWVHGMIKTDACDIGCLCVLFNSHFYLFIQRQSLHAHTNFVLNFQPDHSFVSLRFMWWI